MSELGSWLGNNFWELVATGALALALYFMREWKDQISSLVTTFQAQVSSLFQDGLDTRNQLKLHSDDMGKATKAINGDMLRIERSILELEKDITKKLEVTSRQSADIAKDFERLCQQVKLSVESFDDRYGSLIDIEKQIEELRGKIIVIDEETKRATVLGKEYKATFEKTREILNKRGSK